MAKPLQNRNEFEALFIARAWKDKDFKQELMRNPKQVIERELASRQPGARLPADLEVTVLEETTNKVYLVLPPGPDTTSAERKITDEDLERAAIGRMTDRLCCNTFTTDIGDLLTRFCCHYTP
jgi:hypothetical protein